MPRWKFWGKENPVKKTISSIDRDCISNSYYAQVSTSSEQAATAIVSAETISVSNFSPIGAEFEFIKDEEIEAAKQEEKVALMIKELTTLKDKAEAAVYINDFEFIESYDDKIVKLLVKIEALREENFSLETKAITKSYT